MLQTGYFVVAEIRQQVALFGDKVHINQVIETWYYVVVGQLLT
jgi:hypothetical protein